MDIEKQVELLKKSNYFIQVLRPCTWHDGILKLSSEEEQLHEMYFSLWSKEISVCFFIPASGAASRMFKDIVSTNNDLTEQFLEHIHLYPFYDSLIQRFEHERDKDEDFSAFCLKIIEHEFSQMPKGMLLFSKKNNEYKTAFEHHIRDLKLLDAKEANIHFTVPETYKEKIDALFSFLQKGHMNISTSIQDSETHTISLYDDNNIVKTSKEEILYRPAGHGALLKNLNAMDSDILFIQNIDNTSTDENMDLHIKYKKILGGLLLKLKNECFAILNHIAEGTWDKSLAKHYVYTLHAFSIDPKIWEDVHGLKQALHKPIRVCGVVKNTGEPGGGPFWVKDKEGKESKQIIESAQINKQDVEQLAIFQQSTHFNPVNMACCIKTHDGQIFDLQDFIDSNAYMVSQKSHLGRNIKILEYPGLWNGSMANWNTLFIEIPNELFKPVKTVFDLLKK